MNLGRGLSTPKIAVPGTGTQNRYGYRQAAAVKNFSAGLSILQPHLQPVAKVEIPKKYSPAAKAALIFRHLGHN
jgi:hypothetical protein